MVGRSDSDFDFIVGIVGAAATITLAFLIILARPVLYVAGLVFGNVSDRLRTPAVVQEHHETLRLRAEAAAAYDASAFSELNPNDVVLHLLRDAMDQAEEPLPAVPVLASFGEVIADLMIEEGWWSIPTVEQQEELSLEDGMRLRNYLRRQKRLFAGTPDLFKAWSEKLVYIIAGMMAYLPPRLENGENDADSAHELKATLVDLAEEPAEMIERLIMTFFDEDVTAAELFEDVREWLDVNAFRASGIDPEDRHRTHKTIALPTTLRRKTPTELVELYLAGTPFERFLLEEFPFSMPPEVRFEHCHIVGGTGHGKTQLLQHLIHHDLLAVRDGRASLVVIDSQGDLIRKIAHLAYCSPEAEQSLADRFMLIDPNDVEYPVGLNMFDVNLERLQGYSAVEREKILNGTIELYEYIFGALLGAELTQKQGVIFRYLARLMLTIPDATVQTLRELMEDGRPFKPYMDQLEGTSKRFFETQFFDKSFASTKTQILRRLWGVLSNTTFERMFSNPRNKVDIFEAMNSGKVILINTAKDLLKQEGCEIFGRFFIAMIAQAALQRSVIPEEERMPTFVYIDEAHDYLDERAEMLFNQARKYKVALHVAHQNLDQLSRGLEASIMASTSIKLAGGVSAKDASAFSKEMQCEPEFVRGMKKRRRHTEFACWIKNTTPQPIKLSIPLGFLEGLPRLDESDYDALMAENRQRYCVSREELERAQAPERAVRAGSADTQEPSTPSEGTADVGLSTDAITPAAPEGEPPPLVAAPAGEPTSRKQKSPPDVDVPPPLGLGGKEHKYLQQLTKQAAVERGYHAVIEQEVLNGAGRVDVALARGDLRLAVEISITTPPEHELQNVEKCLAAGFDQVILVGAKPKHLNTIKNFVMDHLDDAHHDRVHFLSPEHLIAHLDEVAALAEPSEETVRGYRVTVKRKMVSEAERAARRQALGQVIRRSLKHLHKHDQQ